MLVRYIILTTFACGYVLCEGVIGTAAPVLENQPISSDQQTNGYIPHAVFPHSEVYPVHGYDYILPVSQYPDVSRNEEDAPIILNPPTVLQIALKMLSNVGFLLLGGVSVLVVSTILTYAFCYLTPICTMTFAGLQNINKETMRSMVTPDGISAAATFVQDAIGKYQRLQRATKNN